MIARLFVLVIEIVKHLKLRVFLLANEIVVLTNERQPGKRREKNSFVDMEF